MRVNTYLFCEDFFSRFCLHLQMTVILLLGYQSNIWVCTLIVTESFHGKKENTDQTIMKRWDGKKQIEKEGKIQVM